MSVIPSIQLNYPIDSEEEEGECEADSVILKRALDKNEKIKELLKSQSLRDIIKNVLDKHEKLPASGSQTKKNTFGLQTWEQTFLKDFILQSKEFKNLVECIMETLSEVDDQNK
uniref:Uncharacterized protein n=1 Tax=Tetranychus urticae TaxID=32264 RepID=T1L1X0_TETUR